MFERDTPARMWAETSVYILAGGEGVVYVRVALGRKLPGLVVAFCVELVSPGAL